jgi:DNA primase
MIIDPSTTKYMIKAKITADGVIEKPDVVGAIFGQTEGLLGNELDLRDLQKSARIGRIEVDIDAKKGKSEGTILLPSSLDKVETAIIGAALESIDRVGPCKAQIKVEGIEDVRVVRRKQVIDRAKQLLQTIMEDTKSDSEHLTEEVRAAVQVAEITRYGSERLPAGPNVGKSDAIIIVEGRNDVLNLLKHGIKNAIAVEGTSIPQSVRDLTKESVTTAFVDGDRGGELIVRELLQTAEVDFVARAPQTREVEELPQKLIMKALKNKIPAEQYAEMVGIPFKRHEGSTKDRAFVERAAKAQDKELEAVSGEAMAEIGGGTTVIHRGGGRERDERPRDGGRRDDRREERRDERREGREERREGRDRDEDRGRRGGGFLSRLRGGPREEAPAAVEAPEGAEPPKVFSGDQERYRDLLDTLQGSLKATLLGSGGAELQKDIAVRDLAETLKNANQSIDAVVFDGVITQRLLDIAADKKIKTVVGAKIGNVTKRPKDVNVYTRDDLR